MDTLIELIVRGLIALFSGSSQQKLPPPRPVPRIPPIDQLPGQQPRGGQQVTKRPPPRPGQTGARPQLNRPQPTRQATIRRIAGKLKSPPPIPRPPSAAPPLPRAAVARTPEPPKPAVVTKTPSTISATAIRQLMLSRRTAMRTIYVLSEVVGPPIALR
jgi:hypothetical protein